MADISQPTRYRNPRDAFGNRPTIDGLEVREFERARVDPSVAESSRARVAAVRQADAFVGPRPPATGIGAPPQITTPTQPGRFSQAIDSVRSSVNRAIPSPNVSGSGVQGVRGITSKALAAGGRFAAPVALASTAAEAATTDTEQYRKRFGLETDSPSLAGDIGVRALGAASDVGNALTFGLAKRFLYRDGQDAPPVRQSIDQPPVLPSLAVPNPTDQRLAAGTQTVPMEMVESPTIATPPRMVAAEPDVRAIEERASAINAQSRDIARQLDAFGPGGGGAGGASGLSSAPGGSASADRFNRESLADSQRQMAASRGIGNMPLRGREAAAFQASASRALTESDQTAAGERIATARNIGELNRASLRDATDRRGQDIGLLTGAAAQRNARDIAELQSGTSRDIAQFSSTASRDVARLNSESRVEAGINAARRPIVIRGGEVAEIDPKTGLATMRKLPDRLVDPSTGRDVAKPVPPSGAIEYLKKNPNLAAQFDEEFGEGAARRVLGK